MAGDDRYFPEDDYSAEDDQTPVEPQLPASVIFMEMMRQAASVHTAAQTPAPLPQAPVAESDVQALPPALSSDDRRQAAAMEAQRIHRVQRRKARRRRQAVGTIGGMIRTLLIIIISAALMATILSWWTNPDSLDPELRASLQEVRATSEFGVAVPPTPLSTPNWMRRIGIISGHRGPQNDPGAVCEENGVAYLTENEVNYSVASRVVNQLNALNYHAELLDEFDPRLDNYQADLLLSIHSNTCQDFGGASGFLVAKADARPENGPDTRLRECVAEHYAEGTGLVRRDGLTRDMTDYHVFGQIHPLTPGVILELGFLRDDQVILTTQPDLLADSIVQGLLCFLEPDTSPNAPLEQTPLVESTEIPTP